MPPTSSGPTARIAERVVNTRFEELSTETITVTKQCLLDIIGVTLAGTGEPVIRILLDEVEDQGVRDDLPGCWFATGDVDAVIEHCRVGGWPPKVSCGTVTCLAWTTTLRRTRSHPVDARQVMRSCIPNARVIRITVANVGLPSSDSAL